MKKRYYYLFVFAVLSFVVHAQPAVESITFTGHLNETVTANIAGKIIRIDRLPYTFTLQQANIPTTIILESPNYSYTSIYIPKYSKSDYKLARWTGEPIDRTYVVKFTEKQAGMVQPVVQNHAPAVATTAPSTPVVTSSVDNAPETKRMNDNTFALIIANEAYQLVAPVEMARHDGATFKKYCTHTLGIPEENVKYHTDASYGQIAKAIKDIKDIAEVFEGKINLIVYYAGHGIPDNATKDAFILPVDADGTDTEVCFSLNKLYRDIDNLHLNSAVFFLDACFSGAQRGGDMIVAARGVAIKPKAAQPAGNSIVFSAASDEEAAYPYKKEGHGLFTYYLLKKLQETEGRVSLGELAEYIKSNVSRKSIVVNGVKQTPSIIPAYGIKDTWQSQSLITK
ncbi:MAG: caspase family protein [Coprobacter sp.]|nr:caspase family protein [Coprobacter sp.]